MTNKMYVVYNQDYDTTEIVGIFSTREAAENFNDKISEIFNACDIAESRLPSHSSLYHIEETELDKSHENLFIGYTVRCNIDNSIVVCRPIHNSMPIIKNEVLYSYNDIENFNGLNKNIRFRFPVYTGFGKTINEAKDNAVSFMEKHNSTKGKWRISVIPSDRKHVDIIYEGDFALAYKYMTEVMASWRSSNYRIILAGPLLLEETNKTSLEAKSIVNSFDVLCPEKERPKPFKFTNLAVSGVYENVIRG